MRSIIENLPHNISVTLGFNKLLDRAFTPIELDLVIDTPQMVIFIVEYVLSASDLEFITYLPTGQPLSFVAAIRDLSFDVSLNGDFLLSLVLAFGAIVFIAPLCAMEELLTRGLDLISASVAADSHAISHMFVRVV